MGHTSDVDRDPSRWVEPAGVRLVFAHPLGEFLADLSVRAISAGGDTRLVSVVFDDLPVLEALIEKILDDLAGLGLTLWPDWYAGALSFEEIDRSVFAFDERLAEALLEVRPLRQPTSIAWIKAARILCRAGRRPLPAGFPRAVQAAQLALAIAPRDLLVALSLNADEPSGGRLLGLARAAEWLGRATGARVLVVVPESLSRSSELDGINFDPIFPLLQTSPICPPSAVGGSVNVWPVLGRPHPYSPGEQLLAKRLGTDEMLSKLFQFNVRVTTRFDSRYLVDLLWPEGRVVVEIDGYEYHSNRFAFSVDRRRDYELVVSGYLVLRLPHDEVIEDVEVAIEKIRDLVQFRRSEVNPLP
jgi:very-short-patch-repair endonuclease